MKLALVLSSIVVAAGGNPLDAIEAGLSGNEGQCALDSAEAVSDVLDAAAYVWASTKRCGGKNEGTRCAIDISAAVEATAKMADIIAKILKQCTLVNMNHTKCGLQAGDIMERVAAFTKATAQMKQRCPEWKNTAFIAKSDIRGNTGCIIDVKNSASSLAKVINNLKDIHGTCSGTGQGSWACKQNVLGVLSAFAGMGAWISGTVGDCAGQAAKSKRALCIQGIAHLFETLPKIAEDGMKMSKTCNKQSDAAKLYLDETVGWEASIDTKGLLLMFLPVTAIVAFIVGKRTGADRAQAKDCRQTFTCLQQEDVESIQRLTVDSE